MSDKNSQRTEDEVLDQTFVGYDDEMTVQTEDGSKAESTTPAPSSKDKNKKQNIILLAVGGFAAVCVVVWKFFLGGQPQPQPQQPEQAQVQTPAPVQMPQQPAPVAQNPATTTVAVTVPEPVAVPAQVQTQMVATGASNDKAPVDPAAQYMNDNNVQKTGDQTNNSSSNGKSDNTQVKVNITEPSQNVNSMNKTDPVKVDVTTTTTSSKSDNKSLNVEKVAAVAASNAEASSNNEQLLAQFQDMLDKKYDPKFDKIEKALDSQKDFNKSIEERLARLESGKTTKHSKSMITEETSLSGSDEAKTVKKVIVRKPVMIKHYSMKTTTKSDDGDIVVDRVVSKSKVDMQKVESVYPNIEIHSIYSGRVWTKNSDGTLSTYSVGDKLSSGEVIKKIDSEKETITTDRRVIMQ